MGSSPGSWTGPDGFSGFPARALSGKKKKRKRGQQVRSHDKTTARHSPFASAVELQIDVDVDVNTRAGAGAHFGQARRHQPRRESEVDGFRRVEAVVESTVVNTRERNNKVTGQLDGPRDFDPDHQKNETERVSEQAKLAQELTPYTLTHFHRSVSEK
jgi:hypothetical protein